MREDEDSRVLGFGIVRSRVVSLDLLLLDSFHSDLLLDWVVETRIGSFYSWFAGHRSAVLLMYFSLGRLVLTMESTQQIQC